MNYTTKTTGRRVGQAAASHVSKPSPLRTVIPNKNIIRKMDDELLLEESSFPLEMLPQSRSDGEEVVMIDTDPTVFGPGVWFAFSSLAARARTPDAIDNFIGTTIPVLINVLCSTCSRHAREHLAKPNMHPDRYRNIKDHRGELIGMFIWIYDFHNVVNAHTDPPKPQMPLDHALAIYSPVLDLTKGEIDADYEAAQHSSTMSRLHHVTFVDEDDPDVAPLEPVDRPTVKDPIPQAVSPGVARPLANVAGPAARTVASSAPTARLPRPGASNAKPLAASTVAQPIKRCTKCGQKANR